MLRLALDKVQQFARSEELLGGRFARLCTSLVPLGGYRCLGRMVWPVFACRLAMKRHVCRLEEHCRALWARRLARQGRGRQEMFLNEDLVQKLQIAANFRKQITVQECQHICLSSVHDSYKVQIANSAA